MLAPFLNDLARFESTKELERSTLYRQLKPDIESALSHVWHGESALHVPIESDTVRAVAWNIERGIRLERVIQSLQEHPALANADVLLLSELDWGMARTGNRFVARELAQELNGRHV